MPLTTSHPRGIFRVFDNLQRVVMYKSDFSTWSRFTCLLRGSCRPLGCCLCMAILPSHPSDNLRGASKLSSLGGPSHPFSRPKVTAASFGISCIHTWPSGRISGGPLFDQALQPRYGSWTIQVKYPKVFPGFINLRDTYPEVAIPNRSEMLDLLAVRPCLFLQGYQKILLFRSIK